MTSPGPLGEEAARLVDALGDWLRSAGSSSTSFASAHVATGSTECQLCPVCQLLAVLKGSRPETFEHLQSAAASVLLALRTVIQAHEAAWSSGSRGGVERIDIGE